MIFTCKCLNITLDAKGSDTRIVKSLNLNLSLAEQSEQFFKEDIVQVEISGVAQRVNSLVQERISGAWAIQRCLNCSTDCYAIRTGNSDALVNSSLITDLDLINKMRNHKNFSPAFRIIIQPLPEKNSPEASTENLSSRRMQSAVTLLQKQLGEIVQERIAKTEEKIRAFSEQEYGFLKEFRDRAHKDHRSLLSVIYAAQKFFEDEKLSFLASETAKDVKSEGLPSPDGSILLKNGADVLVEQRSGGNKEIRPVRHRSLTAFGKSGASFDSEGLFVIEGMDENVDEVGQSEGESDTDHDDSGSHDEGIDIHRKKEAFVQLAKSLPVNVPVCTNVSADLERDDEPLDAVDIAASIKALARSVHGDAVFGDLPRPRFSTQI